MRPPEEVKRDLVQQWVTKADRDFRVAEHLVSQDSPYLDAVAFHSQQAAEKYLKAFLVEQQVEFPKTHDLAEILDVIATVDSSLAQSCRGATELTPYGVDIRYPSDFPQMTPQRARAAVELARKVRETIRELLDIRD